MIMAKLSLRTVWISFLNDKKLELLGTGDERFAFSKDVGWWDMKTGELIKPDNINKQRIIKLLMDSLQKKYWDSAEKGNIAQEWTIEGCILRE